MRTFRKMTESINQYFQKKKQIEEIKEILARAGINSRENIKKLRKNEMHLNDIKSVLMLLLNSEPYPLIEELQGYPWSGILDQTTFDMLIDNINDVKSILLYCQKCCFFQLTDKIYKEIIEAQKKIAFLSASLPSEHPEDNNSVRQHFFGSNLHEKHLLREIFEYAGFNGKISFPVPQKMKHIDCFSHEKNLALDVKDIKEVKQDSVSSKQTTPGANPASFFNTHATHCTLDEKIRATVGSTACKTFFQPPVDVDVNTVIQEIFAPTPILPNTNAIERPNHLLNKR